MTDIDNHSPAQPSDESAQRVLSFWFGELDENGCVDSAHAQRWYKKDAAFDQSIRDAFLLDYRAVVQGGREHWLRSPRGRLAYVIVLDQFSRNMFRESPDMFAHDALALKTALRSIELGDDRVLELDERCFLYLPLMHAEVLEIQNRCVDLFTKLTNEVAATKPKEVVDKAANSLDFAIRHRDIIARFGRFPHRNALLGRASTPEESEFLSQPGSSF